MNTDILTKLREAEEIKVEASLIRSAILEIELQRSVNRALESRIEKLETQLDCLKQLNALWKDSK